MVQVVIQALILNPETLKSRPGDWIVGSLGSYILRLALHLCSLWDTPCLAAASMAVRLRRTLGVPYHTYTVYSIFSHSWIAFYILCVLKPNKE